MSLPTPADSKRETSEASPATDASPEASPKVETPKRKRTTLTRRLVRSGSGAVKTFGYILLAMWWTLCLVFNVPVLFTYWGEYCYEKWRKFNIYPMPKLALMFPILSIGPLLAIAVDNGLSHTIAAYIWIVFLVFTIYTIADDMTWPGATIVLLFLLVIIIGLGWLGERQKIEIFRPAWLWLESWDIPYPVPFVLGFSALGGFVLFIRVIIEMSRVYIHVQGNTFKVIQPGVSSEAHSIADYDVRVIYDDFNERMVFRTAVLMLVPNDPDKPTYRFNTVYNAHLIAQHLQEMKDAPDVELKVRSK